MRLWTKLIVLVLMLGMAAVADAKGTRKHVHKPLKGKIVSISGTDLVIAPHHAHKRAAGKTKTIHTSTQTAITIHGVKGKAVSDLVVGQHVTITHNKGMASKVTVAKKHHKKHHKAA